MKLDIAHNRKRRTGAGTAALALLLLSGSGTTGARAASAALIGWPEEGLHEMNGADASVFVLAPPYSTLDAQLMVNGALVKSPAGITVTYQAVADATGSINATSQGKGNFYDFAQELYGQALGPDQGLAGCNMPGPANQPQPMRFDATRHLFTAPGIPLTPYDDQGHRNEYPLMRLIAKDQAGNTLATTDVALPVTDTMDCRACHASGSSPDARPMAGWVWNPDPEVDYKLNILRYHDGVRAGTRAYTNILQQVGYDPAGLYVTVTQDAQPVVCTRCHTSNAVPGSGAPGMRPFTQLIHTKHAFVTHPTLGVPLNQLNSSETCFQCHAGPSTRFLSGVHHNLVNADGSLTMQCQNCHGAMTTVGAPTRQGWLQEPNCQSCHTGTALQNNGELRYTNVFVTNTVARVALNTTYATQPDVPAAGLSLFHASVGHGGLQCAACHGAAHAELPTLQANVNLQSQNAQGHPGVLADCTACHVSMPASVNGGPHGLHPVGEFWVQAHGEDGVGRAGCQACHGLDYRGTVLATMAGPRSMSGGATSLYWQGFEISCYTCHNGPGGGDGGGGAPPPTVADRSAATTSGTAVPITLQGADPSGLGLAFQIVSQPAHGTVTCQGNAATYYPASGFVGNDTFTYAAWDGYIDSNLGTVTVATGAGHCALSASATAPAAALPGGVVPFRASATLAPCAGTITYDWDFGDGAPHGTGPQVMHVYPATTDTDYSWTLTVNGNGQTQLVQGVVTISPTLGPPVPLTLTGPIDNLTVSWPADHIPVSLETSYDLTQPYGWQPVPDVPTLQGSTMSLPLYAVPGAQYFRLRRVP